MSKHEVTIEDAVVRQVDERPTARFRLAGVLALSAFIAVFSGFIFGYKQLTALRSSLDELNQAVSALGEQQQLLDSRLESMHSRLDSQNSMFETRKTEILALQEIFSDHQHSLQTEREKLQQQEQKIKKALEMAQYKAGLDTDDWVLVEAEYLLSLANNRLRLEGDVVNALKALEAAYDRLQQVGGSEWVMLQQQVIAKITALKAIKPIDRTQISTRLAELSQQIASLPMVDTESELQQSSEEFAYSDKHERSFKTLLQDSWQGFKSIVVVRHRNRPLSTMLSLKQRNLVQLHLRLQLQAARLALLKANEQLYSSSLHTAEQWLVEFYDTEQETAHALLAEIRALQQLHLYSTLPDLSDSLQVLREYLKQNDQTGAGR